MPREVIVNTSVDDIRSSLAIYNPQKPSEIREALEYLNRSLVYETQNENRSTVIQMLQRKIKALRKL